ncbi:MAG: phage Bipper [Pseudomonadota bacterium]|jgi:protein gp37
MTIMASRCNVNFIVDLALQHQASPAVLNPVKGCDPYGPGCGGCWAKELVGRFGRYPGLTRKTDAGQLVWTGELAVRPEEMDVVDRWKKPRVVFLNDLGDLFHSAVPLDSLFQVLRRVAETPAHLYVLPTHRVVEALPRLARAVGGLRSDHALTWPPRNLVILSSQENGREASKKLPAAAALAKAGWRIGVSYEPALGPGGVDGWDFAEWVILGAMQGAGRPMTPEEFGELARATRDWCAERRIPFYLKQAPSPKHVARVIPLPVLDGAQHRGLWRP